jgi:hypothetical protein
MASCLGARTRKHLTLRQVDGPDLTPKRGKVDTYLALEGKNEKVKAANLLILFGDPSGSRTRVPDVRGRCPNH